MRLPDLPIQAYSRARWPGALIGVGASAVIVYRLLGPIEIDVNGRAVDIGGQKQRALLEAAGFEVVGEAENGASALAAVELLGLDDTPDYHRRVLAVLAFLRA